MSEQLMSIYYDSEEPYQCISLKNYNATNHLNNVIQAISSCPLFIKRLRKLNGENIELGGLSTIIELITIVIDNAKEISVFESYSFKDWNSANQRDCYELLMLMMNKTYEEIRISKSNPLINVWLKVRLPLRIIIEYSIFCECGYNVFSPSQSELSINLSTVGHKTENLQALIDNYFADSLIDGRVCDTKTCLKQQGQQTRKLLLPLPETLCIHIERDAPTVKAGHSHKLVINKNYCAIIPKNDIIYSLKSVIVFGDVGCYRKAAKDWYYIGDDMPTKVGEDKVLKCKADVLFYELNDYITFANGDQLSEIGPGLLTDYCLNSGINCALQGLASCQSFIDWLDIYNSECDMPRTRAVSRLTAMTNQNDSHNESIEMAVIKDLNCKDSADVYELVRDLFAGILDEIRTKQSESDGELSECPPWQFMTSYLLECGCGSKILSNTKTNMSIDISIADQNSTNLQTLVDLYFQEESDLNSKCSKTKCPVNKVSKRIILHHKLPRMICVHLENDSECIVELSEQLILFGQFSTISEQRNKNSYTNETILFHLRSVILPDGSDCYRKMGDQWFRVDDGSAETINVDDVLSCNPRVLFYESEELDEEIDATESNKSELKDSHLPNATGTCLNRIIQSLSSCVKFVDWVNMVSDNTQLVEIRTLSCLINPNAQDDKEVDNSVLKKWNDNECSNIFEVLKMILGDVIDELDQESTIDKVNDHPIMIYNFSTTSDRSEQIKWLVDLQFSDISADNEPIPLQTLLDNHLEIWSGYNQLQLKSLNNIKPMTLNEALPVTICFHFECVNTVMPVLDIIVKNISCGKYRTCQCDYSDCCRRYCLRSVIDRDGFCYRISNDRFYKMVDGSYSGIDKDEVLGLEASIMMYQWQQ